MCFLQWNGLFSESFYLKCPRDAKAPKLSSLFPRWWRLRSELSGSKTYRTQHRWSRPHDGPLWPHDGPLWTHDGPLWTHDGPLWTRGPLWPHDGPQWPQRWRHGRRPGGAERHPVDGGGGGRRGGQRRTPAPARLRWGAPGRLSAPADLSGATLPTVPLKPLCAADFPVSILLPRLCHAVLSVYAANLTVLSSSWCILLSCLCVPISCPCVAMYIHLSDLCAPLLIAMQKLGFIQLSFVRIHCAVAFCYSSFRVMLHDADFIYSKLSSTQPLSNWC